MVAALLFLRLDKRHQLRLPLLPLALVPESSAPWLRRCVKGDRVVFRHDLRPRQKTHPIPQIR